MILFYIFLLLAGLCFWLFLKQQNPFSPLWIMLYAWGIALAVSRLRLSSYELSWPATYWMLVFVSLISFALGVIIFDIVWRRHPLWEKLSILNREQMSSVALRLGIYVLFALSIIGLVLFYIKAGNFPLLSGNPDAFRFTADEKVPGLINYTAQLARIFIPLSFFLIFWQKFSWRKHLDLIVLSLIGTAALILFASRTQIFFIDLWVMALYLFMRRPNFRQALKFYPFFLFVSVLVLAAVPLIRQYQSYGENYLGNITGIDTSHYNPVQKALVPIYVGLSFNQQALLHAHQYYHTHELQLGKVTLDPFTNILGLHQFKPHYDLGAIFYDWWNTGTYLFPFVQDFGDSAFYWVPFLFAGLLTLLWHYFRTTKNFLSINLYAYAMFFVVMTVYLSFTVRAEMYIDLFLLLILFCLVQRSTPQEQ